MVVADKTRKGERFLSLSFSPSLSSVHVGKGVCNAVESSGAKSQMELPTCRGVGETTGEGLEREERRGRGIAEGVLSDQVWLYAHKHNLELVTLFDVSRDANVILPRLSSGARDRGNEKEVVEERG